MQKDDQAKNESSLDSISKSLRKAIDEAAVIQAKFATKLNGKLQDTSDGKIQSQSPKESMDTISKRLRGLIEASKPLQEKLAAKLNR